MISTDKKQKDYAEVRDALVKDEQCCEIFACAFDFNKNPRLYFSGDWKNLAMAAAYLQQEFIEYAKGNR